MNTEHFNLSELLSTFYSCGWVCNSMDFKSNDWNEFGYYKVPDLIHISVKLINDDIIIKKNYDNDKLLKVNYDKKYQIINELCLPEDFVFKCYKIRDKKKIIEEMF